MQAYVYVGVSACGRFRILWLQLVSFNEMPDDILLGKYVLDHFISH